MEPSLKQSLQNASYEARRKASLAYEPVLREMASAGTPESEHKLRLVITQLVELAGAKVHASRSGGIMGLASTAIALGPRLADYLGALIMPVLACFEDHDSKIRYYACESMYNIAKVAHGEILVYFNELFDALSKLAADPEVSVKNGAELLDRQLKDIVQDQAALYISRANHGDDYSPDVYPDGHHPGPEKDHGSSRPQPQRAFSLPRFIPLLHERLSVLNPFTRTFLISWLITLDQVPDLELITFLPDFLDGLLRYLGDPTDEVRCSTESLLEDLLREIREARKQQLEGLAARREAWERDGERRRRRRASEARTVTVGDTYGDGDEGDEWNGKGTPTPRTLGEHDDDLDGQDGEDALGDSEDDDEYPLEGDGSAEWLPGQGVHIEYGAIVEILVQHLSFPDEEIQATCLHWISQFLSFVPGVVVPFAPRLIPVILSALAHHVEEIQQAASDTNDLLFAVIQALPVDGSSNGGANGSNGLSPASAADFSPPHSTLSTVAFAPNVASPPPSSIPFPSTSSAATPRPGHDRHKPGSDASSLLHAPPSALAPLSPSSDSSSAPHHLAAGPPAPPQGLGLALAHDFADPLEPDAARFAYGQTVNELTLQFLSDNEETRVAALEWLLMLHQKAPRKILAGDDPSLSSRRDRPSTHGAGAAARSTSRQRNPSASSTSSGLSLAVLLKLLSDSSERVLRYDLQLLAQISSLGSGPGAGAGAGGRGTAAGPGGDDEYFAPLMSSLLELFSTDRKLLETRGSLIIRQLCGSLNAERIYRTCAEILEKDEDLEFASVMVQNLNLIMITSPELSEFRKRLRTLDSKDGQNLFVTLYRSWSHNAVATFTLCLLAQAYEQASALLQIFADLEMTVPMLIQIDKLVQLIESPVFTSLRLQLLEPERHPYLLKAMYGLLMLLPQSSAFATLRNRLSAVSSLGFLQTVPRASLISPPHRTTTPLSSTLSGPSPSSSGPGSSSNPTLSSLARTRADAATPDPPSIRWTELLAHFRGVQKRRQAAASPARAVGTAAAAAQGAAPPGAAAGDSVSPRADVDGGGAGGAGAAGGGSSAGSRLVGTAAAGRRRPTGQAHGSASGSGFVRAADTASVGSSSVQSGRGGGSGGGGRVGGSAGGGPGAAGLRALSPPLVGTAGGKRRMQGGLAGGGTAGGGAGAGAGSRRM